LTRLLVIALPVIATLVACGIAFLKGDNSERHGAMIMFVAWVSGNLIIQQKLAHGTTELLFAIDVVVFGALAALAWTSRRAWAILASLAQAFQILVHIALEMGLRIDELTYIIALSISGYGQLLALAVGAVIAWREREALASFGIVVQPDEASSPARARSISASVFSTPKIATKDPNRGPWF
jgi:hypothetical protein